MLSLGGMSSAKAKTIRCDAVFQPTVADVLEKVNQDNGQFLFQGKSFEEHSQNLSWMRKRKIRKLVRDLEVRSFPSEKALERYSIELGTALFGSKDVVDRWIFKSKEERLEESSIYIIKEQLLQEGLLKTWGLNHDSAQVGMIRRLLDRLASAGHSPYGQLLRLPYYLPTMKDQKIHQDLMYKVIRDGFISHSEEVRLALGKQSQIEAYNTFRKLYSPVFLGVMLITSLQHAYAELERIQDQQVQKAVQELRTQRKSILNNIDMAKQEIFQQTYDAAVAEFIQKWGEPPTPEEQVLLKAKIEKALKMH